MVISSISSLRTSSVETTDSNQKAKKTFRPEKQTEIIQDSENKTKKRSFEMASSENGVDPVKRPRLEADAKEGPMKAKVDNEPKHQVSSAPRLVTKCLCNAAPLAEEGGDVCGAVEIVGGHRVGCKNKVTNRTMVRTSRAPHSIPIVLCEFHRRRLASHAVCPLCGEFCSHGLVYMCRPSRGEAPLP